MKGPMPDFGAQTTRIRGSSNRGRKLLVVALMTLIGATAVRAETVTTGPSAFCHVVDGAFTSCSGGGTEWSDITGITFATSFGLNVVYTEMNSTQDQFFLMYDWLARTDPIGAMEHVSIRFNTVENNVTEQYEVHIFGDGSLDVLVNGSPEPAGGITGAVAFGSKPGSPDPPHAEIELQIPMRIVYSPDIALFWTGNFPPNPNPVPPDSTQPPHCPDGSRPIECRTPIGGQTQLCCPAEPIQASASEVFTSSTTGKTTVTALPLGPISPTQLCTKPSGAGALGPLVDAAVPPTGSYRNHGDYVSQVARFVNELLADLVIAGVITEDDVPELSSCLVSPRARPTMHAPMAGEVLIAGSVTDVTWDSPGGPPAQLASLLSSFDDGLTWTVVAEGLPNTGSYSWTVPSAATDQARLTILLSYDTDESESAMSDRFSITTPTGVGGGKAVFALRAANPVLGPLTVSFSLPTWAPAMLAVFDVSGRRVMSGEVGFSGPGWHAMKFGRLPAGMYTVQLSQAGRSLTSRVVVIR